MADPELGPRVRAEIGDVTIYLVRLADVLGTDLVAAALDKLADSARRYPVEQARGSAAKARDAARDAAEPRDTAG